MDSDGTCTDEAVKWPSLLVLAAAVCWYFVCRCAATLLRTKFMTALGVVGGAQLITEAATAPQSPVGVAAVAATATEDLLPEVVAGLAAVDAEVAG